MPSRSPNRLQAPRAFARLVTVILISALATPPSPAAAENGLADFFGSIFGGRHAAAPRAVEAHPLRRRKVHHTATAPSAQPAAQPWVRSVSAPPAAGPKPAAGAGPADSPSARPPPSFFVAVIGDSEAAMLAQGLSEAFADDPRVAILNKAREDTGLVRDDFFDWRQAAKTLLDGPQHIDVAVIQIGINDNQRLHDGGAVLDPLSKPFNDVYAKRVEEIATAFRDRNTALVWVGLPIMRSESLSHAALVFNDIDRQYAGARRRPFRRSVGALHRRQFGVQGYWPGRERGHPAPARGGWRAFQQGRRPQGGAFRRTGHPPRDGGEAGADAVSRSSACPR